MIDTYEYISLDPPLLAVEPGEPDATRLPLHELRGRKPGVKGVPLTVGLYIIDRAPVLIIALNVAEAHGDNLHRVRL